MRYVSNGRNRVKFTHIVRQKQCRLVSNLSLAARPRVVVGLTGRHDARRRRSPAPRTWLRRRRSAGARLTWLRRRLHRRRSPGVPRAWPVDARRAVCLFGEAGGNDMRAKAAPAARRPAPSRRRSRCAGRPGHPPLVRVDGGFVVSDVLHNRLSRHVFATSCSSPAMRSRSFASFSAMTSRSCSNSSRSAST